MSQPVRRGRDERSRRTVRRFELVAQTGEYEPAANGDPKPLAWLLGTVPDLS